MLVPFIPVQYPVTYIIDVVKAGKARYIGASSMEAWRFAKMQHTAERNGWTRFITMQPQYNLLYREEEREMLPLCEDQGVGVIPWSPMARGRLTRDWSVTSRRTQNDAFALKIVADLIYFMAIARHRSFSRAAIELGVSASALSHALKGLETRLGVRLLNRTTKSVTPTAAGEELVQSVLQPFDTIEGALESLNRYRNTPTGRIRINAAVEAANLLLAPVMPAFMDRYPDIEIDIVASNRMVDVTDAGFDAGIRYGGTVPEDMVARRLSADIRWVIAASPDYLERYGTPEHPDDLLHHRCISNRLGDDRVYRWELARDGETYQMTVPGSVTVNHAETGLVAVLGGAGLMYFPEPLVAPYVKDGRLRLVLTEWSPLEEGFHIYYSSRRQLPTGLRLLIEFIQEARPLGL